MNDAENRPAVRRIPSVDKALRDASFAAILAAFPRDSVLAAARKTLDGWRKAALEGGAAIGDTGIPALAAEVGKKLENRARPMYMRVVNGTGIVLHTGLGRAPFCPEAVKELAEAVSGYSRLAFDLATGRRHPREDAVRELICELTGSESAQIVNNNAAATMIVLNTVAAGREVICARGQLVEIGGAFRIPEVMEMSGARLKEVGTTNRVHLRDYERAIDEKTAAILKVHTSNYRIVGFTSEVPVDQLARLGRSRGLPVVDDIGSGAVFDMQALGLDEEPRIQDSVAAGADLICFSADKLLGGPQAGIILGRKEQVDRIRTNPLMRALRVGKMTLAVLEHTLKALLDREHRAERHTVLRLLSLDQDAIRARAEALRDAIRTRFGDGIGVETAQERSEIGGGTTPTKSLPTWVVIITVRGVPHGLLGCMLRTQKTPVCGRVQKEGVMLDLRTFLDGDEARTLETLDAVMAKVEKMRAQAATYVEPAAGKDSE